MTGGVFVLCVLAAFALAAVPALVFAKRKGRLSPSLVALPFAPAVALDVALLTFNSPAQVGWGSIVYPFFCIILCVALLYLLVFLLPPHSVGKLPSNLLLAAACIGAFVFGVMAAPWYE